MSGVAKDHFLGVVIHIGVIKPRGAGMAGVVRLVLLTVHHPHHSLKGAGKAAVVHRPTVDVDEVRPLCFEPLFNQRPYQVMDGDGADARRSL